MSDQIKPVAYMDNEPLYSAEQIQHLQAKNVRLLNSLVWMRGRLSEYGLNLMSHSKYEKMNSDIKLLDAIIAEAGNNNV